MKKDIFDLLNQVETDLGKYEIHELSRSERGQRTTRLLNKVKEKEIRNNPEGNLKSVQTHNIKKFMGAVAIFLVCLLSVGGVAYAMTDGFHVLFTFISGGAIYETSEGGVMTTTSVSGTASETGDEPGVPLLLEDGRLYFTGDGGKTDITDLISETEPYFIDVIDEKGNTHKFIVGGRPEEGYYGYDEMIIDTEGAFRGGAGRWGSKIEGTLEWMKKGENAIYSEVFGKPIELW